jgi:hypothetical protein
MWGRRYYDRTTITGMMKFEDLDIDSRRFGRKVGFRPTLLRLEVAGKANT